MKNEGYRIKETDSPYPVSPATFAEKKEVIVCCGFIDNKPMFTFVDNVDMEFHLGDRFNVIIEK